MRAYLLLINGRLPVDLRHRDRASLNIVPAIVRFVKEVKEVTEVMEGRELRMQTVASTHPGTMHKILR